MLTIDTNQLRLTSLSQKDWAFFSELHSNPEVMKFVSDPLTNDEVATRFTNRIKPWQKQESGWLSLLISEKASNRPVGITGAYTDWKPFQQAEIGFLLAPEFQGRGYAKASAIAVINFLLKECQFHKINATVSAGNQASYQLLLKLGFQHEGTLRQAYKINGNWLDDWKLGLLASELP